MPLVTNNVGDAVEAPSDTETQYSEGAQRAITVAPGALKHDAGKAPVYQGFLAYFPRAIMEVAQVSAFGKEKYNAEYSDKGFMQLVSERYADASVRHLLDEVIEGTVINKGDGGVRHDAQVAWDALARLEIRLKEEEERGTS